MEELLKPFVEKALKLAEQSGEFIIDQAPELLQQFYAWHTAQAVVWIAVSSIVLLLALLWIIGMGRKHDWEDIEMMVPVIFGGIGGVCSIAGLIFNILDLVKITVAPKLYLIEHFLNTH